MIKKPRKKKTIARAFPDAALIQRQASDPLSSVWVTASAGTGKTKVLTDRVLRLMLSGATPDEILCLTFTRAAAAVMKNRIRDELAAWSAASDDELKTRLSDLTGAAPTADDIARARRLFPIFLDSGDAMRIQTIHAFSQSLLRHFPIESGIPPYFDVMDDQTAAELLREAQVDLLKSVHQDPSSELARAVNLVTPEVSEDDFVALMSELTYRRGELLSVIDAHGGLEPTIDAVFQYLSLPRTLTIEDATALLWAENPASAEGFDAAALLSAADVLSAGTRTEADKAIVLRAWLENPAQRADLLEDYISLFLTAEGGPRKRLTTKETAVAEEPLRAEAARLQACLEVVRSINVARHTESVLRLTMSVLHFYTQKKRDMNLLDYDDLVYQAGLMMEKDNAAAWALQKLPGNLRHILVDEAQDTNPDQWKLIASIAQEFFLAGKPADGRTLFVVGDEKQSIFSFQRADPREFARRKLFFKSMIEKAGGSWRTVEMKIAFRSSPAVTQAVDAVFSNPEAADGLFSEDEMEAHRVEHQPFRTNAAGTVEVHPVIAAPPSPPLSPWTMPLQAEEEADTAAAMAETIADQIKSWLDKGEKLDARGRPINPADILILVRRRSAFVDHMVRALKKRDVPVAGADRISLREQIVVMDLMALADVVLSPNDDYKLACVLKSPLIGLNEQQLADLAIGRTGSLINALRAASETKGAPAVYATAVSYLEGLQKSLGKDRPYEFYSTLLLSPCPGNATSGLLALYERLGFEAEDPLVEFMNAAERFEKVHIPSLQGFLAWMNAGEAEVKRELSLSSEAQRVHIMTVHGAKGLEAPIVILPDTTGIPEDNIHTRPRFLWPEGDRRVPLWVPRADLESDSFIRERKKAELHRDREYRRLLYVAMTRAADRLYVYGAQNGKELSPKSWYALIKKGMLDNLPAVFNASANDNVLRFSVPQSGKAVSDGIRPLRRSKAVGVPVWARTPPKKAEEPVGKFRPSMASEDENRTADSPLIDSPGPDEGKRHLGTIVHALLEFLPDLSADQREEAARRHLSKPAFGLDRQTQDVTLKNVLAVLGDPRFSGLFGPRSQAEVPLTGFVSHKGVRKALSGIIDRLAVDDTTVTVIDYKNLAVSPTRLEDVPPKYLLQMAAYKLMLEKIYPGKKIVCALLFTGDASYMPLPDSALTEALTKEGVSIYTPSRGPKP